jgi:type IV secretory pathway TrbF-like protein
VGGAEIDSVLSMGEGEESFRVQWTEEIRTPGGALERRELWQALVTVAVDPPEAIEEVLVNPLGIRVVDFDWQRIEEDG